MSSALLSSLPRFDLEDQPPAAGRLKALLGQTPDEKPQAAPLVVEPAAAVEVPANPGPTLAEAERLVADLSGLMKRLERDSREQSMHVLQSLAARLFPELSRQFLAEEIGQHIGKLVPASVPAVEIRARQVMLDRLEPIVRRNTVLSGRCTLVPATAPEDTRVEVSWKTGGVTFDFEGLLAACLAHLDPAQTLIEE
ncbi:MAG: hypothetical protein R3C08_14210 [Hyphomonas sp.]